MKSYAKFARPGNQESYFGFFYSRCQCHICDTFPPPPPKKKKKNNWPNGYKWEILIVSCQIWYQSFTVVMKNFMLNIISTDNCLQKLVQKSRDFVVKIEATKRCGWAWCAFDLWLYIYCSLLSSHLLCLMSTLHPYDLNYKGQHVRNLWKYFKTFACNGSPSLTTYVKIKSLIVITACWIYIKNESIT